LPFIDIGLSNSIQVIVSKTTYENVWIYAIHLGFHIYHNCRVCQWFIYVQTGLGFFYPVGEKSGLTGFEPAAKGLLT
jgi:hypothetical protein